MRSVLGVQRGNHVIFVIYQLSLIWILPFVPFSLSPPSLYNIYFFKKAFSALLLCDRHSCISQHGLRSAAATNSPNSEWASSSKDLLVGCAAVHPTWPGRGPCSSRGSRPIDGRCVLSTLHVRARGKKLSPEVTHNPRLLTTRN